MRTSKVNQPKFSDHKLTFLSALADPKILKLQLQLSYLKKTVLSSVALMPAPLLCSEDQRGADSKPK